MFTGIIEEIGEIKSVSKSSVGGKLTIKAKKVLEKTNIGDSIAVNGVCLTVTELFPDSFTADVMGETMRRSGFKSIKPKSKVNLERAMSADGRFGGHIVSGHIDCEGKITDIKREDNAVWVTISAEDIIRYVIEKGSIAIDGVSLTVACVNGNNFSVSIIPHTGEETILLSKNIGENVNLEADIIGKYTERLLSFNKPQKTSITADFLAENGFL